MPHGDAHEMGAGVGGKPICGDDALPALWSGRVKLASFGGGGETTGLVCGYLACDGELLKPVLAGLPRVVRVNIRTNPSGEWLDNLLRHAVSQVAAATPGSEVILAHLAEVLFTEVLRRYLLALPDGRTGWLAGAGDPAVGRALAALHREPAFDWTLDLLAEEAGISRSALTEKFTRFIGQAPMAYLTDWRLELGADVAALHQPQRATRGARFRIRIRSGLQSCLQAALFRASGALPARSTCHRHREDSTHAVTPGGDSRLNRSGRQREEFARRGRAGDRHRGDIFTACQRDCARDPVKMRRFIATRLRCGPDVTRHQIGCVGFEHQAVRRSPRPPGAGDGRARLGRGAWRPGRRVDLRSAPEPVLRPGRRLSPAAVPAPPPRAAGASGRRLRPGRTLRRRAGGDEPRAVRHRGPGGRPGRRARGHRLRFLFWQKTRGQRRRPDRAGGASTASACR